MEELLLDESSFRVRSNTWPLPRPDLSPSPENEASDLLKEQILTPSANHHLQSTNNNNKKNTSRRNAWGNMSYADLITQAIQGSTDKRLTLSQIYEWMVQNVPYFKDKGDSNSSAGWKVSSRCCCCSTRVVAAAAAAASTDRSFRDWERERKHVMIRAFVRSLEWSYFLSFPLLQLLF